MRQALQDYIPKSFICWKEGYTWDLFLKDLLAGITVGIISLPLAIAIAIGSGVEPEQGLFTAIIAGFLISFLGGSRVQIGGPTGAFIVIVYSVVQRWGYEGLATATFIAGILLLIMGLVRFGILLKFIPHSVVIGFTAGIALSILSSQVKDFFGMDISHVPADFIQKWKTYFTCCHTWNPWAFVTGSFSLWLMFFLRSRYPRIPGAILAVILTTLAVSLFKLPVETIFSKFGELPSRLPTPSLPNLSFESIQQLFPDAITIALLGGIESLLSAVVADGMIGTRHKSNCELVAQGFANIASTLFKGIPATGALARTSANIKLGAKTPISGMIHALTILILILFFAPLAGSIPLPTLSAVLVFIAWNMVEFTQIDEILNGKFSDILVLLTTFSLTVLIDLTVAVQVGVLLAALIFMKHMSDSTYVKACQYLAKEDQHLHPALDDSDLIFEHDVPPKTAIFEVTGPLFFGVSDQLNEAFKQINAETQFFILRMRKVPIIDASGINALSQFHKKCAQKNILLLISGLQEPLKKGLARTGIVHMIGSENFFSNLKTALEYVKATIFHKHPER